MGIKRLLHLVVVIFGFDSVVFARDLCDFDVEFPRGPPRHRNGLQMVTEISCPANYVLDTCKCEGTCAEPNCVETCSDTLTCVCPDGYLMLDGDCVPQTDCGCFTRDEQTWDETVVPEGDTYVPSRCEKKCLCENNNLTCDANYTCDPNAECEERDGLFQCYCPIGVKGDGLQCSYYSDCTEMFMDGVRMSGIYPILPADWTGSPFDVYCNMSHGGGWTLFHRQVNDSQDFYLYWEDYKSGFGNLSASFWLGNDKLHSLTNQGDYELRVDILGADEIYYYAIYDSFRITNESDLYRMSLGVYSEGDAGDSFSYNNNWPFTTRDSDSDDVDYSYYSSENNNIANGFEAGWWFRRWPDPDYCCLNSPYGARSKAWTSLPYNSHAWELRDTEMKLRRK